MIIIENLTKSYDTFDYDPTPAISDITLTLPTESIAVVLGANGAGKTTLLKCMAGLTKYKGKINFLPIGKLAYVTEEGSYFPELSAEANGGMCAKLFKSFDLNLFKELIKKYGLPEDVRASKLSRGQQSALEVCLGICKNADYLLLDEPFIGTDIFVRRNFLKMLIEYKKPAQTLILTTHLLEGLNGLLDYAYIIKTKMLKCINFAEECPDLAEAMRDAYAAAVPHKNALE